MELVYDCFGVDNEIHSENCYAVNAGPHMSVPFPQLPESGMTVTYDRTTALTYEDIDFLTWEHPLVRGAMDIVLAGEAGNTSVIAASIPDTPRGTIVLESIFVLEPYASQGGSAARFLSPRVIRIMIDQNGKRLDKYASISSQGDEVEPLQPEMVRQVIRAREKLLRKMSEASEKLAEKIAPGVREAARDSALSSLGGEIERLKSLSEVNPNVRPEEIAQLESHREEVRQQIDDAVVRLDSLRVIVCT